MSGVESMHSSLWYRVAVLKPRLASRARLYRHRYRGELWYLLQDPGSNRVHRFPPSARLVIAAMDGRRTVDEIWQLARRELGEAAPTQDDLLQLLGQLHGADLLQTDGTPDAVEAFERGDKQARSKRRRSWSNPMALRIPLLDPGAFLDRHATLWRRLWSRWGAAVWLAVVLPALALLPGHWPELTGNLSDRMLRADNLLLLLLVFPLIKALHEMGHATATRAGGGEVHDVGVMLLVLMPVPYVDASSVSVLRSRWSRALVGAAGMLVELFLAALAFYLWLAVEPGLVRSVCFNIMLVAGVSTLIFNGNPLLRYDAYYILADLVEMPNLAQQASAYWGYLVQRYVLRLRDAEPPAASAGARAWLMAYGLASTAYRLFVTVVIALFIGGRFFFFGVLMALWAVGAMVALPVWRAFRQLQEQPALRERRGAILAACGAVLAVLVLVAALLPVRYRTQAEGVLWLPEQAMVRAGASGFLARLDAEPGGQVQPGQLLVTSVEPGLAAQVRHAQARVAELEATYLQEFATDRGHADIIAQQLALERDTLRAVQSRAAGLLASAQAAGVFMVPRAQDQAGRWHRKGELIGYVLGNDAPVVRVVVEQADADAVRSETRAVALRLPGNTARVLPGHIARIVPAANEEVPSTALLAAGGGRLAGDPRDPHGRRALERVFVVDVAPDGPWAGPAAFGQRVHVRFDLVPQPLAVQLWRSLRRLFLAHFNV